jgi:hypothetical protein
MARPKQITLKKREQATVMKMWKQKPNARFIADSTGLPRHQVMAFLESQGVTTYSEGSYR